MATKKAVPSFPVKKTGKTPKDPNKAELEKLKNLVGRQDDVVAQLQDNLRDLELELAEKTQEIDLLEGRIENYREILKTLLEITE